MEWNELRGGSEAYELRMATIFFIQPKVSVFFETFHRIIRIVVSTRRVWFFFSLFPPRIIKSRDRVCVFALFMWFDWPSAGAADRNTRVHTDKIYRCLLWNSRSGPAMDRLCFVHFSVFSEFWLAIIIVWRSEMRLFILNKGEKK